MSVRSQKGAALSTAAGFTMLAVLGTPYAWGIFVVILTSDVYGWSSLLASSVLAFNLMAFAWIMRPAGEVRNKGEWVIEKDWLQMRMKVSTSLQAMTSGALVVVGYLIASIGNGTHYLSILIGYTVMGLGIGIGYGVPLAVVTHWYTGAKRSARLGLVVAGFGLSSVLMILLIDDKAFVPVLAALGIDYMPLFAVHQPLVNGLSHVFLVMAGVCAFFTVAAAMLLRDTEAQATAVRNPTHLNGKEILATASYQVLMIVGTVGFGAGLMSIIFGKKFPKGALQEFGIPEYMLYGAIALVTLLVANTVGRWLGGIVLGFITRLLGDAFSGAKATLILVLSIQAVAILALPFTVTTPAWLFPNMAVIGLCFGSMFIIMPAIVIETFGLSHWPANYGFVFRSYGYGAIAIGMGVGGLISMISPSAPFFVAGPLLAVAALFATRVQKVRRSVAAEPLTVDENTTLAAEAA